MVILLLTRRGALLQRDCMVHYVNGCTQLLNEISLFSRESYFLTLLTEMAVEMGQDLKKITFKDQSWLGLKTRSRKFLQSFC